jgi:hypothetical protein
MKVSMSRFEIAVGLLCEPRHRLKDVDVGISLEIRGIEREDTFN